MLLEKYRLLRRYLSSVVSFYSAEDETQIISDNSSIYLLDKPLTVSRALTATRLRETQIIKDRVLELAVSTRNSKKIDEKDFTLDADNFYNVGKYGFNRIYYTYSKVFLGGCVYYSFPFVTTNEIPVLQVQGDSGEGYIYPRILKK